MPKVAKEKRANGDSAGTKKTTNSGSIRNPKKTNGIVNGIYDFKWERLKMGKYGQLFDAELQGRLITILLNIDHPYYQKTIANKDDDFDEFAPGLSLIASFAITELNSTTDEQREQILQLKNTFSFNLAVLLA